jgi:predicted nuclease with TOPRIM domain
MWKETTATEPPRTTAQDAQNPVTEEELRAIFERLDTARDVFSQNRELREVLSRRESETRGLREVLSRHETETLELRSRNAELEEILRKYAPMLLHAATTMGLAAKDTPNSGPVRAPSRWQQQGGVL